MPLHIPLNARRQQLRVPGILGGLGPLAHIEFEQRLLQHSFRRGARSDQEHPDWLLYSASSTPDRTEHLLGTGADCVPNLIRSAQLIESMGASFIVVTCNTAHALYQFVQPQIRVPWLHMMQETAHYVVHSFPDVQKIGVLATDGTLEYQLYQDSLSSCGLSTIFPPLNSPIQNRIMQAVYNPDWGIKSSGAWVSDVSLGELAAAFDWLADQGADLVIAGCTEISVGLAKVTHLPLNWIDPLDVLAELTLNLAYEIDSVPSILTAKNF